MSTEQSLSDQGKTATKATIIRVVVKTIVFFLLCNIIFTLSNSGEWLGKISGYNLLFPGRERLPWSENPKKAYSLSLNNLDAMFASHQIAGISKADDEFRVIIIGDSSTWGFLLPVEDTLSANLNQAGLFTDDGKQIKIYNLGFPTISLTKDLLILDYAMQYDPDLILWLVTLEAFPNNKQVFTPLVQNNPKQVIDLINEYTLNIDTEDEGFNFPTFMEKTLIGQRKELANMIRLQFYGALWAATSIDQDINEFYEPRRSDFDMDESFKDYSAGNLNAETLAFDVLKAGVTLAGDTPVLIINEPIFISDGVNSDIRYNHLYPRWAYDLYRKIFAAESQQHAWHYLDLWDLIPPEEFTNTAIHLTPYGTSLLAQRLQSMILSLANQNEK